MTKIPTIEVFRRQPLQFFFQWTGEFVCILYKEMTSFLCDKKERNDLLQVVYKDIKVKSNIAGLKCLCLISKLINGSLWHVINNDEIDKEMFS